MYVERHHYVDISLLRLNHILYGSNTSNKLPGWIIYYHGHQPALLGTQSHPRCVQDLPDERAPRAGHH